MDRRSCPQAGQFYNVFYMTGQEYDVVVVGSGAAGMVAASRSPSGPFDSSRRKGPTLWRFHCAVRWRRLIPNNEIFAACGGKKDTPKAARTYLHKIVGDVVPAEKIDTYLQRGPEMLSFVLKNSPLKLCWVPNYSDYYPEVEGGRAGGRSVELQAVQREEARRR